MQISFPNLYFQLVVLTFFFNNQNESRDLPTLVQREPSSDIPLLQRSLITKGAYSSPADKQ